MVVGGIGRDMASIGLSQRARKQLECIRVRTEAASLDDVIWRAFATYDSLWKAIGEGKQIIIRDTNGTETDFDLR